MRPLEIALVLAQIAVIVVCSVKGKDQSSTRWLLAAPLLFAALQLRFEGYRWHMLPAYIAVVLGLALILISPRSINSLFWLAAIPNLGLTVCAIVLSVVFPVFEFPRPTGPYSIGTSVTALADRARHETAPGALPGPREIVVQAWYPAENIPSGTRDFYQPKEIVGGLMSQLAFVRTHSILGAPVSRIGGQLPLVIFSPSWGGDRRQDTFLFEELASHGYVVVSLDHPYGTGMTVFPDGRVVRNTTGGWLDFASSETLNRSTLRVERELDTRVADVRFVLDELSHTTGPLSHLASRINPDLAGIIGHSFGGTVAAEACWQDKRFKAAVNMDGLMMGKSAEMGVEQPFLSMSDNMPLPPSGEKPAIDEATRIRNRVLLADVAHLDQTMKKYGGYAFALRQGGHMNFSDTPLYSRLRRYTGAGRIDTQRAFAIVRAYTLAFFDEYLRGIHQPLLDGPSRAFPEVIGFQFRRPTTMVRISGMSGVPK